MDAPADYKTAGIFMLVAGIVNFILAGLLILMSVCLWFPSYVTLVTAILEIIFGIGVLQGQPKSSAKNFAIIGLVGAACSCSWIGILMEILAIVWLGKDEVQAWLAVHQ